MKNEDEIRKAVVDTVRSKYPGMTYEQGIEAALRWVLEEMEEEEAADFETDFI